MREISNHEKIIKHDSTSLNKLSTRDYQFNYQEKNELIQKKYRVNITIYRETLSTNNTMK
jgi:hypothetical protein